MNTIYWIISIFWASIFIIYILSIVRVLFVEHKIKNLEADQDKKIQQVKSVPGVITVIKERQVSSIKDQYESGLSMLKRDRQFILDKLPFYKK